MSRSALAMLAVLVVVPSAAALQLDAPNHSPAAPEADPAPLETRDVLETYYAVGAEPSERAVRMAILSHLERQGAMPRGLLAAAEAAASEHEPDFRFRWAYPAGDLDADGVPDLLVNELDWVHLTARLVAVSGRDGRSVLWTHNDGFMFEVLYGLGVPGGRPGLPFPLPNDSMRPTADLDGDGIGDAVVFNLDVEFVIPSPVSDYVAAQVILITSSLEALAGPTGASLWKEEVNGVIAYEGYDPAVVTYLNVPSGWLSYDAPDGPRVAYKTTDITIVVVYEPTCMINLCLTGFYVEDFAVTDHVTVLDARDKTPLWTRHLNATDDANHTVITWLTGAADLGGGHEPEIILDHLLLERPIFQDGYRHPITNDPLYQQGVSLRARALEGSSGDDLWNTLVFDEDALRLNVNEEDAFPVYWWHHAQILDDTTGDGVPDPVVAYLTQDTSSAGTVNGQFRTTFVPLDGASGRVLFKTRFQGWGYAATLSTADHHAAQLVLGTVDVPSAPASQGRFPLKEIHIKAVEVPTGRELWEFSDRFAQDSYLTYDLTLNQYLYAFAPHDWDGDGVRDVITPAHYIQPTGANQTLLSTTKHTYTLLSGVDGKPLRTVTAWGPAGFVLGCGSADGGFTVLSGHSRRLDLRHRVTV